MVWSKVLEKCDLVFHTSFVSAVRFKRFSCLQFNNECVRAMELLRERYLTIRDVCQRLRISRGAVDNLRRSGRLPEVRIGRAVRFRERDVEDLLRKCYTGELEA